MIELKSFEPNIEIQSVLAQAECLRDGWNLAFRIIPFRKIDLKQELDFFSGKVDQVEEQLWKKTCFECFFGMSEGTTYYEFNGSPSGHWNLFRFDSNHCHLIENKHTRPA